MVRSVGANTGQTTTLTTTGKIQNQTPVGPPVIDPVPNIIHLRGNDLIVTTLTGFASRSAGPASCASTRPAARPTLIPGLTAAIDAAPLGHGANDPLLTRRVQHEPCCSRRQAVCAW